MGDLSFYLYKILVFLIGIGFSYFWVKWSQKRLSAFASIAIACAIFMIFFVFYLLGAFMNHFDALGYAFLMGSISFMALSKKDKIS